MRIKFMATSGIDQSRPWELKPCKLNELENKTRKHLGDEYWEKNKEELIDKWHQSVIIEDKRVNILNFLSEKDGVSLDEIVNESGEKNKTEALKILAVMKYQNLISGIDNRIIVITELGKEYLKHL